MVVHGQIFSFDLPYENHVDLTDHHSMAGKAVLICRPNSHPFVDRTLSLDHPVKIGRSVARARAAQTNGIFDCKVLSRNHALIWYNNGKFYLQDTKSSNGTFVNNQRLSKSGEDSSPREVSSGDIVQFGVDVLENTRKVTHGCIVANLKLYLPDGKEAKASLSTSVISGFGSVSLEDLYELNQHIQEALQREQMLETKLAVLQQLVLSLKQAADVSWRALIAEDRLLSRVETLEYQLQTYANKNFAEDKLREELRKLQEEKSVYQGVSKECLQKVLQEKLEVVQKCQDIERSLLNAEQECSGYKEIMARNHAELQDLANKHTAQVLKIAELQTQLQETEEDCKEALARVELENEVLNSEMNRMLAKEAEMKKKIKQLEASGKIVGRQLLGIQTQFQLKRSPDIHDHINSLKEHNGDTEDVICKNNDEEELKEDKQKDINSSMDSLISRLTSEVDMQSNFKEFIVLTQAQISLLQEEKMSKLQQINSLEAEIELHVEKLYKYKEENKNLEQSLTSLEEKYKEENTNNMDTSLINSISVNGSEKLSDSPEPANVASLQAQMDELKEAIKESQSKVEAMERTINLLQEDLLSAKRSLNETTKNWLLQEEKLQKALTIKEHSDTTVNELCEHLKSLETSLMQAKLQEKIELESEHISKHKEETTLLRKQLLEAQQTAKQNKNEVELVKEKLRVVSAELEMSKSMTESSLAESQVDNKYAEELIAARLEAAALEARVASLEAQIKKLKLESNQRQQELEESNQAGTGTPEDKEVIIEKLRLRVNEMEEELVLVKEKYMACNEKNTQLEKKFSSLRQDYEAVVHQPYFNVVFALPLLILFIAMTIAFHPTLASLMGTLDSWPDT